MKTLWSCIIFALLLLVQPVGPVSAFDHNHDAKGGDWPWLPKQQLQAPDGASSDIFGYSVAVSGNNAVIGAPFHDQHGQDAGAAYVYLRSEGGIWKCDQELYADDAAEFNHFGRCVAVSGSTALIASLRGSYFFDRCSNCEQWNQTQKFNVAGGPVSISGDIALIGAHVYVRSGGVWTQEAVLPAADVCSVSVDGDTAVIGACHVNDNTGAAYVFVRQFCPIQNCTDPDALQHAQSSIPSCCGYRWVLQAELAPTNGTGSQFGYSVSLDSDTALIGAPFDDAKGENYIDAGAAYTFIRVDGAWTTPGQKLFANDAAAYQHFGSSVSLDGDKALIGAQWHNIGPVNTIA